MDPVSQIEQMIAFGQYWDALSNLNQLISRNGKHAETRLYRLRADCQLKMGMTKEAIADAAILIKRGSPHERNLGYQYRAHANLRQGLFKPAEADALEGRDSNLRNLIQELKISSQRAEETYNAGDFGKAAELLDRVIQQCPQYSKIVLLRINIAWEARDFATCKNLMERIMKDNPDNQDLHYINGVMMMCDNKLEDARAELRLSTRGKNTPKNASIALKRIVELKKHQANGKKAFDQKNSQKVAQAIQGIEEDVVGFCPSGSPVFHQTVLMQARLMKMEGRVDEALQYLNKILEENNENDEFHIERAELLTSKGDLDGAIFDYQLIASRNPNNHHAQKRLQELQQLQKEKSRVDYYGDLGITQSASASEIKDAYRKAVRTWHPDKFQDPEKKKEAEAMMKKINIAYEILSDTQKKRIYDSGGDPESGIQSGGSPFDFDPFDILKSFTGGGGFEQFFTGGNDDGGGGGGEQKFFTFGGNDGFHFEMHFG